ncbi:PREDICTED: uncharacterized protein LOC109585560 [Amphimedon queenslandica]|uniref:Death domain-containing protein n=1 Tax=Amphimedon queenslandica TaxID=400682 RepID=A0AAN0JJT9_AMPQE|nr:PREDICTED: uncharacterized protein LOC109585560 [Amphimedon queenslandica]|eukprot:XP_019857239.1 PREDICTED: uncharacterized protein LOC109585560 [Amphimedon queenslandica]
MATRGEMNCQPSKILDIKDLNKVISTLERSDFPEGRWSDLGLRLQIDPPKLDTVRADNPLDVKGCLRGCLKIWLHQSYDVDTHGKPSLEKLATALKEMGLRAVADKILGNIEAIESEGWSGLRRRNEKTIILATIESNVYEEFHQLESTFATLVAKIRAYLAEKIKHQKLETIDVARFIEEKRKLSGLTNEVSIDRLFNRILDHYSYLNCSLIEAIVQECFEKSSCMEYITYWLPFVPHSGTFLRREMKAYVKKMSHFKDSKRLKDLQFAIGNAYMQNFIPSDTACKVVIKLNGGWDEKTISDLEFLLRHYFNQSDIFNHIQITHGSVCISYLVPCSAIAHITTAVKSKSESMHRVGVFYFSINDDMILLDEKDDFNFDKSLVEAVKLCEVYEVSLLLSLGADPYYENDNGDKVLELALQGRNEEIIKLISVAADTQVIELESQEELTDEEDKEFGNDGENETLKVEIQRLHEEEKERERAGDIVSDRLGEGESESVDAVHDYVNMSQFHTEKAEQQNEQATKTTTTTPVPDDVKLKELPLAASPVPQSPSTNTSAGYHEFIRINNPGITGGKLRSHTVHTSMMGGLSSIGEEGGQMSPQRPYMGSCSHLDSGYSHSKTAPRMYGYREPATTTLMMRASEEQQQYRQAVTPTSIMRGHAATLPHSARVTFSPTLSPVTAEQLNQQKLNTSLLYNFTRCREEFATTSLHNISSSSKEVQ